MPKIVHCKNDNLKLFDLPASFFSLFFPSLCAACSRNLRRGEQVICTHCKFTLPLTDHFTIQDNPIERLFAGKSRIAHAAALYRFEKGSRVQQLVHGLKYGERKDVGILAGEIIGEQMSRTDRFGNIDVVIPVPLHASRLRKRGYNQAECISEGICRVTGWRHQPDGIRRIRNSETQTNKQRFERFTNIDGIFEASNRNAFNGCNVLLVDDVITTGSTLIGCADVLLASDDVQVSIVAMAAAVH